MVNRAMLTRPSACCVAAAGNWTSQPGPLPMLVGLSARVMPASPAAALCGTSRAVRRIMVWSARGGLPSPPRFMARISCVSPAAAAAAAAAGGSGSGRRYCAALGGDVAGASPNDSGLAGHPDCGGVALQRVLASKRLHEACLERFGGSARVGLPTQRRVDRLQPPLVLGLVELPEREAELHFLPVQRHRGVLAVAAFQKRAQAGVLLAAARAQR